MLLLVALLIVALFTATTPDTDVDKFADDFRDAADDTPYLIGQAMQILVGVFVALLGASLYVLFRGRDRFLSLVGYTGFVLMAALFVAGAAANITVHNLAESLSNGTTIAGEAEVQEIGRALTDVGDGAFFLGVTFFAIGLLGFGAAILGLTQTVEGVTPVALPGVPPTWLGWLAIAAGVLYLLAWLGLATEVFFVALIVAFLLTIVWYLVFGIWLLRSKAIA
jgi:hypothetical protein